jgi:hypothetical protein
MSKLFPFNLAEMALLQEWKIVVVSLLFVVNDLTGHAGQTGK